MRTFKTARHTLESLSRRRKLESFSLSWLLKSPWRAEHVALCGSNSPSLSSPPNTGNHGRRSVDSCPARLATALSGSKPAGSAQRAAWWRTLRAASPSAIPPFDAFNTATAIVRPVQSAVRSDRKVRRCAISHLKPLILSARH